MQLLGKNRWRGDFTVTELGRHRYTVMGWIDNAELIAYSKHSEEVVEIVLAVNLDPGHTQAGRLRLPLEDLGIGTDRPYQVHDLLSDAHCLWHGVRNYIELNPSIVPAHIFRSGQNFDYFMKAT